LDWILVLVLTNFLMAGLLSKNLWFGPVWSLVLMVDFVVSLAREVWILNWPAKSQRRKSLEAWIFTWAIRLRAGLRYFSHIQFDWHVAQGILPEPGTWDFFAKTFLPDGSPDGSPKQNLPELSRLNRHLTINDHWGTTLE
jgi:hypothetical protein